MGKPSKCKVTAKLISAFVLATQIVQFLFYLNPKFLVSSSFLCLYKSVYVGPVRIPHCWFIHEEAQIRTMTEIICTLWLFDNDSYWG